MIERITFYNSYPSEAASQNAKCDGRFHIIDPLLSSPQKTTRMPSHGSNFQKQLAGKGSGRDVMLMSQSFPPGCWLAVKSRTCVPGCPAYEPHTAKCYLATSVAASYYTKNQATT